MTATGEIAVGLSGAAGEAIAFRVPVPTGKTSISVISYGGTGTISLFGADERPASGESYDVFSTRQGNAETIRFMGLADSAVYFIVSGESAFSGGLARDQAFRRAWLGATEATARTPEFQQRRPHCLERRRPTVSVIDL